MHTWQCCWQLSCIGVLYDVWLLWSWGPSLQQLGTSKLLLQLCFALLLNKGKGLLSYQLPAAAMVTDAFRQVEPSSCKPAPN
jgi:hypothetical protein